MKYECVFLLVLGCIGTVSTYQCYLCNNDINSACGDPFDKNSMTASDKVEAWSGGVCAKAQENGRIIRTVIYSEACPGGTNGCAPVTEEGFSGTICCCTENLCNGVSMVREQSFIILIAMSVLTILVCQWF